MVAPKIRLLSENRFENPIASKNLKYYTVIYTCCIEIPIKLCRPKSKGFAKVWVKLQSNLLSPL